jgi:hypothetical protein
MLVAPDGLDSIDRADVFIVRMPHSPLGGYSFGAGFSLITVLKKAGVAAPKSQSVCVDIHNQPALT